MSWIIVFLLLCSIVFPASADQGQYQSSHDCFIVPTTVTDVGSPVRGVVKHLLVDRGDTVARGQAVAELEAGYERIMVRHAEARVDTSSELAAREAELELAKMELIRIESMHQKNLAPTQLLDEARGRKQVALAGLVQALESQKLMQIELQRAEYELALRTVRSPVDGVVVEQRTFPGEFIYDEPVMTIAALDPLHVEVVLPARLFGSIALGSEASVYPELRSGEVLAATIDVVDPLLDTASGTFGVRLLLPNKELALTAGQKCTVDLSASSGPLNLAEETE